MKPQVCSFCKGDLQRGNHEFISRIGNQIIAISDIPAWICVQCGEAYYDYEISQKLADVRKKVQEGSILFHPMAAGSIKLSEIES